MDFILKGDNIVIETIINLIQVSLTWDTFMDSLEASLIKEAFLVEASFIEEAFLMEASLMEASLMEASLMEASLMEASLMGASFIREAFLIEASFTMVVLTSFITEVILKEAASFIMEVHPKEVLIIIIKECVIKP